MRPGEEFFNLHAHDLLRVAVGTPAVRVADPAFNAEQALTLMHEAARWNAALVLFPELGLSAYSCDDLFHQRALLDGCLEALGHVVEASAALPLVSVVGVPLEVGHALYNCAAVVAGGRVLGVVPKTYLPNYREFYYTLRFGYAPAKVAFLAWCAWHDVYRLDEIKRALAIFLERFFKLSQFKRSCIPNAPKVGSGGSLSPRGDWRAPSDGEPAAWLARLALVPEVE